MFCPTEKWWSLIDNLDLWFCSVDPGQKRHCFWLQILFAQSGLLHSSVSTYTNDWISHDKWQIRGSISSNFCKLNTDLKYNSQTVKWNMSNANIRGVGVGAVLGLMAHLYFGHCGRPAGAHRLIADHMRRKEGGTDGDATSYYSHWTNVTTATVRPARRPFNIIWRKMKQRGIL